MRVRAMQYRCTAFAVLASLLVLLCILPAKLALASSVQMDTPASTDLFGRCSLFDNIVGNQMLSGKITAEQAFAELDSHNCPIIRGASITSPQQLQDAVERSLQQKDSVDHAGHPDSTECQKLSSLVRQVWSGSGSPKQVMDDLTAINCPTLTSCKQFDRVKRQYTSGYMSPSQAVQELALKCPLFSPPASEPQAASRRRNAMPPGQSMADECRKLSDMLYTVDETQSSPAAARAAELAIDKLCATQVPLITNCPLFQGVKARYENNEITAQMAVGEMKANCPILSKELNPGMIFNFEEYGMHRDPHYDAAHESHSHQDPLRRRGCCCHGSKQLEQRDGLDLEEDPGMCLPGGKSTCNHDHHISQHAQTKASGLERLLGGVFPKGNPAAAALLATFYISLFPNLILFATPSSIPNSALRIMVGFAVGGLLGDVFLHLLPHMFSSEHDHGHGHSHDHGHDHDHGHAHVGEHARHTVFGCTIFFGLMMFFVVDKFMRLLGNGHSHGHSHGHGHSHSHGHITTKSSNSSLESKQRLRKRRATKSSSASSDASEADDEKDFGNTSAVGELDKKEAKKPIRLSAYLNLFADAAHNFTDGLAMSASFYLSHAAGLSTFVAVFFHEIPHELGDFAILVQSGFSRTSALASQFFTALGAIAGTIAGIMIEETGKGNVLSLKGLFTSGQPAFVPATASSGGSILPAFITGIFSLLPSTVAGVPWSQLVIPFTAGGFIYVGTVSVLPDLLQPDEEDVDSLAIKSRSPRLAEKQKLRRGVTMALVELGAMLVGLAIMAIIALTEE
ncbi:hypothetical protein LPJ53_005859 [Coemansia erecta]|uniref:Zip-domain-containing protein n=1 Tax=Coemansia erecta TaxID=147472 RepID=A0A9W7XRJ7_9FUNG|nr:hypothetical protein LPJ53_005859 [Coemansia erecta]